MLSWLSFLSKLYGLGLEAWTVERNQFLFGEEFLYVCVQAVVMLKGSENKCCHQEINPNAFGILFVISH